MKRILVLAGGVDQIGLLNDLKKRGYYTIIVDYNTDPVAKPYADKHIQASTLDHDTVLQIAIDEKVENIITACTDQALLTVAYVAQKLNFPRQFDFEEAQCITNKLYMKKVMIENQIPTARYINIVTLENGIGNLEFPLIVKPANCNSSTGVQKVESFEELEIAFRFASEVSRTNEVIVEEFIEGMEVSVDGFVLDGNVNMLMASEIRKLKLNHKQYIISQSVIPAPLTSGQISQIEYIMQQIATSFRLNDTPLLVQLLINSKGVYVIEFSARIGGGLKYLTIKEKTGLDILHENVNAILGEPVNLVYEDRPILLSRVHLYVHPGVFDHIAGYEELISDGTVADIAVTKGKGVLIDKIAASGDRVGNFLVRAKDPEDLSNKIQRALSAIKVYDIEGNDILYRELYS